MKMVLFSARNGIPRYIFCKPHPPLITGRIPCYAKEIGQHLMNETYRIKVTSRREP